MRPRKHHWIVLTPLETLTSMALFAMAIVLAFTLGVYTGEKQPEETDIDEDRAMSTIDHYLQSDSQPFHFEKVLDSDNPDDKQYLYTLNADGHPNDGQDLKRLSPGDTLAAAPVDPVPIPVEIPPDIPKEGYVIQVESFEEESRAKKKQAILKNKGFPTVIDVRPGDALPYRLLVGPYPSKEEAQARLPELRKLMRPDAFIMKYKF